MNDREVGTFPTPFGVLAYEAVTELEFIIRNGPELIAYEGRTYDVHGRLILVNGVGWQVLSPFSVDIILGESEERPAPRTILPVIEDLWVCRAIQQIIIDAWSAHTVNHPTLLVRARRARLFQELQQHRERLEAEQAGIEACQEAIEAITLWESGTC